MADIYSGNDRLNEVIYNIIELLISDENQESRDLKKLLYYPSKTLENNGEFIDIYSQEDVEEEIYNKYIFPYNNFIEHAQLDDKSLINVYLDGFYMYKNNGLIEDDVICIEINISKSQEAIKIKNKIVSRSLEMKSKIQKLLDGQNIQSIGNLKVLEGKTSNIQNKYHQLKMLFNFHMER